MVIGLRTHDAKKFTLVTILVSNSLVNSMGIDLLGVRPCGHTIRLPNLHHTEHLGFLQAGFGSARRSSRQNRDLTISGGPRIRWVPLLGSGKTF